MLHLFLLAMLAGGSQEEAAPTAWIETHAKPVATVAITADTSDLALFGKLADRARVLAFGEGTHDSHELWSFRNRLFAYLVEQHGYTAIAAETGFGPSIATDDYVLGKDVSPALAAKGVFSWARSTFQENLDLVQWMRAYNARPTTQRKIRFYGLETNGCMRPDGRPLVDAALAYVAKLDPALAAPFATRFAALTASFNRDAYKSLPREQQAELTVAAQDLVSLYERWQVVWISKTTPDAYFRAYRLAVAVRQLASHLRMGNQGRDIADAETLRWAIDREGTDGRIFVFAHNMHVTKWRQVPANPAQLHSSFGELAAGYLGDRLVTIGSLYDNGTARDMLGVFHAVDATYRVPASNPDSMNAIFAKARGSAFAVALHDPNMPDEVQRFLSASRPFRNLNIAEGANDLKPSSAFDALLFVRSLTPQLLSPLQVTEPDPFPCEPGPPKS